VTDRLARIPGGRSASAAARLPVGLREAILEDCVRALPNEACGLLAGDAPPARGGRPTRWLPARNVLGSPYRFQIDADDLLRLTLDIDDAGEVVWAVVHSHVGSPAIPSPTDRREHRHPAALQIVVSLEPPAAGQVVPGRPPVGRAELRAWRAAATGPVEVPLLDD
jgi:proteasome lid subunit RPN8/RPN11